MNEKSDRFIFLGKPNNFPADDEITNLFVNDENRGVYAGISAVTGKGDGVKDHYSVAIFFDQDVFADNIWLSMSDGRLLLEFVDANGEEHRHWLD